MFVNGFISEVCNAPSISNGRVLNALTVYKPGFSVIITCDPGYKLVNSNTQCQSDRTWNPTPECVYISCQMPVNNHIAYIVTSNGNQQWPNQPLGTVIRPYCSQTGHAPSPSTDRTCLENGNWSGTDPTCIVITCNSLPNIKNGHFSSSGVQLPFSFNHEITLACETGYYSSISSKNGKIQCVAIDTWSGHPKCLRITCEPAEWFFKGRYNGSQHSYDYGSVIVPSCEIGYYISNNITYRKCEQLNKWSRETPECDIVQCEKPYVSNGSIILYPRQFNYNTVINIQCYNGYEIRDGSYIRTCQADGSWGTQALKCVRIQCNDTSDVKHESILQYPELAFGETGHASYNSTYFYMNSGSAELSCSTSRKLSWTTHPVFGIFNKG